jgi:hypothetical protein
MMEKIGWLLKDWMKLSELLPDEICNLVTLKT